MAKNAASPAHEARPPNRTPWVSTTTRCAVCGEEATVEQTLRMVITHQQSNTDVSVLHCHMPLCATHASESTMEVAVAWEPGAIPRTTTPAKRAKTA